MTYFIIKVLFEVPLRLQLSRHRAFAKAFNFVYFNKINGDYLEFGVGRGTTMRMAINNARVRKLNRMSFIGVDTFSGFPETSGPEVNFKTYSSIVGSRSFSRDEIHKTLKISKSVDLKLIECNMETGDLSSLMEIAASTKISIAHFDMDYYAPTINALKAISHSLSVGTVLLFDNYFFFAANDAMGERKALNEFKFLHPEIVISSYFSYGWHGQSFIVTTVNGELLTN